MTDCEALPYEVAEGDGKLSDVGEGKERPGGEGNWRLGAGGGFIIEALRLGPSKGTPWVMLHKVVGKLINEMNPPQNPVEGLFQTVLFYWRTVGGPKLMLRVLNALINYWSAGWRQ